MFHPSLKTKRKGYVRNWHVAFIGEASNTNFKVCFDIAWTESMMAIWACQIGLFEIQAMKVAISSLDGVNIDRSYISHDQ